MSFPYPVTTLPRWRALALAIGSRFCKDVAVDFSMQHTSPFGLMSAWILLTWILTAIVRIAFAFAVFNDADIQWRNHRRKTFLVGGGLWALATLLGGVFVAAAYWAIHHSTLRPPQPANAPAPHLPPQ